MSIIQVRVTTFDPGGGSAERIDWRGQVTRAITQANRVYSRHGITFHPTDYLEIGSTQSGRRLTHDIRSALPEGVSPTVRRQLFRSYMSQARAWGGEFALRAAEVVPIRNGMGVATSEAFNILEMNRVAGQVATYWVPRIISPASSGQTICAPMYANFPLGLEGIFIKNGASPQTLAHELGHLLMRCMHCQAPKQHHALDVCECASTQNLMHGDGDARSDNPTLNEGQVRHLRITAGSTGYLRD